MSEYVALGDTTKLALALFHPASGYSVNGDETPRYYVFKDDSDTVTLQGAFTARTGFKGQYRASVDITLANGFASGVFVHVLASGRVEGISAMQTIKTFVVSDAFGARLLDTVTHGGSTAVLQLERVAVTSLTTNTSAVQLIGNGTGAGLNATGGATGAGMLLSGGGTSGPGLYCLATDVWHGIITVGGATGNGFRAQGGVSGGDGISASAVAGNGRGMSLTGFGGGAGMYLDGGATAGDLYLANSSGNIQDVCWNFNNRILTAGTNLGTVNAAVLSIAASAIVPGTLHANTIGVLSSGVWSIPSTRTVSAATNITTNGYILTVGMDGLVESNIKKWNDVSVNLSSNNSPLVDVDYLRDEDSGDYRRVKITASNYVKSDIVAINASTSDSDGLATLSSDYNNNGYLQTNILRINGSLTISTPSGYALPSYVYGYIPGLEPLRPSVSNRTLDVTASGTTGINWGNIQNQSTSVNLSTTTVNTVNTTALVSSINSNIYGTIASGVWTNPVRTVTSAANITSTNGAIPITAAGYVNSDIGRISNNSIAADNLETLSINYINNGYLEGNITHWQGLSVSNGIDSTPLVSINSIEPGGIAIDQIGSGVWENPTRTLTNSLYYYNLKFVRNNPVGNWQDRYAIQWYKDGSPVTSGQITNPALSVYNTLTGATLVSNGIMSYSSPVLGQVYYQATDPTVQTSGIPYMVVASGTIDGSSRTWNQIVGLDFL